MSATLEYWNLAPEGIKALRSVSAYVAACSLDRRLTHLVYLRISQINGCAYCCDMHTREAVADGETPQRLSVLAAWREAPNLFSEAERAALDWAECLTRFADAHSADEAARDAAYGKLAQHFSEKQIVDLALAIATMNAWNRIAVGFHQEPLKR